MDFSQTVNKERVFNFSDFGGDPADKGSITIVFMETCPKYTDGRKEAYENKELTPEMRSEIIMNLAAKHLIKGWKGLTHKNKLVKYSQKNAKEMMKSKTFAAFVLAAAAHQKYFEVDIDLDVDFEEVEKN